MLQAIGALAGIAAKYGYDEYKRHQNRNEKRDFLSYQNQQNYGYYIQSLLDTPLAQRQGLEKAGYNPMLALGHIGSSSYTGVSSSSGDIPTEGDLVSSAKEGANLANDLKEGFENEQSQIKSSVKKNSAEASATKASIGQEDRRLDQRDKEIQIKQDELDIQKTRETREGIKDALDVLGDIGLGVGGAYAGKKAWSYYNAWLKYRGDDIIKIPMKNTSLRAFGDYLVPLAYGSAVTGASLLNAADSHKKIHYDDKGDVKKAKSWKDDLSRILFVPSLRR